MALRYSTSVQCASLLGGYRWLKIDRENGSGATSSSSTRPCPAVRRVRAEVLTARPPLAQNPRPYRFMLLEVDLVLPGSPATAERSDSRCPRSWRSGSGGDQFGGLGSALLDVRAELDSPPPQLHRRPGGGLVVLRRRAASSRPAATRIARSLAPRDRAWTGRSASVSGSLDLGRVRVGRRRPTGRSPLLFVRPGPSGRRAPVHRLVQPDRAANPAPLTTSG